MSHNQHHFMLRGQGQSQDWPADMPSVYHRCIVKWEIMKEACSHLLHSALALTQLGTLCLAQAHVQQGDNRQDEEGLLPGQQCARRHL